MKYKRQFPNATPYTDCRSKRRWRYRAKGFKAELGTEYGSPEFVARYEAAHGLRKACARRLAEAGATPHMIAAVTGHATLAEVERYTRDADRAGLADAGFAKLVGRAKREQTLANVSSMFAKRTEK